MEGESLTLMFSELDTEIGENCWTMNQMVVPSYWRNLFASANKIQQWKNYFAVLFFKLIHQKTYWLPKWSCGNLGMPLPTRPHLVENCRHLSIPKTKKVHQLLFNCCTKNPVILLTKEFFLTWNLCEISGHNNFSSSKSKTIKELW